LRLYCYLVDEGDIITVVSDGVHDNLDPKLLGRTPKEVGLDIEWDAINKDTPVEVDEKIGLWTHNFMNSLLKKPINCNSIQRVLLEHSVKTTVSTRQFFQDCPGKKLPNDYALYPGKMDHTTCLAFKIGIKRNTQKNKSEQKIISTTTTSDKPPNEKEKKGN